MELQLICGRAATGKTQALYRLIGQALKAEAERPVLLLVPEQTTLSSERELLEALNLPGSMKAQIMSPKRLSRDVFSRMGGADKTVIDERGRAMALRRVCTESADKLKVLGRVAKRSAFAAHLSSLFSDLKRFRVDEKALSEAADRVDSSRLSEKLRDLSTLMEGYEDWMRAHDHLDDEDALYLLAERLGQDEAFRDAEVFIDGFDYLPPGNIAWISALTAIAHRVTVTLCTDRPGAPDGDIFAAGEMSRQYLRRMADEMDCPVKEIWVERETDPRPAALRFLERALYAYPAPEAPKESAGVAFLHPEDPEEEAEQAARLVSAWVRQEGLRYRDIVILCGNLASSSLRLKRVFARYGLPLFLDERRSVLKHPLVHFAVMALETVSGGYRREAFLDCLKTGFCSLERETLEAWERQMNATSGRGKRALFGPYRRPAQGVADLAPLHEAGERMRQALEKLEALDRRHASAADWAQGLEDWMRGFAVPEQLEARCRELESLGDRDAAAETAQVWEEWQDMLGQLTSILGETPLSAEELSEVLEAGFLHAEIGVLPVGLDRILCGDIGRTKLTSVKRLLILGAADGVVPASYPEDALLNDRDMAALEDLSLTVGRDAGIRMAQSQFGVYHVIASPEEQLILSCPEKEDNGTALRRSTVMERIEKLLQPEVLHPDPFTPAAAEAMLGSAAASLRRAASGLSPDRELPSLLEALCRAGYGPEVESLRAGGQVQGSIEASLLGKSISVTRLEEYARCPFLWFAASVLRPETWEEAKTEATGAGITLHEAAARFGWRVKEKPDLTPEEAEREMGAIMDALMREEPWASRIEQPQEAFLAERMRSACLRTARLWSESLSRGDFRPENFEMDFGKGGSALPLILPDGSRVEWTGTVDRVDRYAREDADVLRIVDYKSGRPKLTVSGVVQGTQLQLWIYLATLCHLQEAKTGRPALPGGVYYAPMGDSFDSLKDGDDGEREALRMSGWTAGDPDILRATDREVVAPGEASSFVTLDRGAKGFPTSQVKSPEDFQRLLRAAQETAGRLAQGMKAGEIPPRPLQAGGRLECERCDYKALCGLRGEKRAARSLTEKQAGKRLRGEDQ